MSDLVVMHNDIVTSAYNLSVNEQRLILCALAKMPKCEPVKQNTAFYVTREDFIKMGASPDQVARDIRAATKDLMKRTIVVPTNSGLLEFQWLKQALRYDKKAEEKLKEKYPDPDDHSKYINGLRKYNFFDSLPMHKDDDNIVVRIVFNDDILPLISDLSEYFVQIFLDDIAGFGSVYSYRVFKLMMRYKSTGLVRISLDDLRFMLVLNDKYPLAADLKKRVIDTAVNEINEKTPYIVKYNLTKKGRKFTHLELKFKIKKDKKTVAAEVAKRDADNGDMFTVDGLSDKQLGRIARNKQFVADYNHLVSSTSPAGQDANAWEFEMINRLKKDPTQFKKRPIREYLEY